MIIFICLLIVPVVFGSQNIRSEIYAVNSSTNIDPLIDQSLIDEVWINYMLNAPTTINLLGQIMVTASNDDISLDPVYEYFKCPKLLRATLLRVSIEGYRAFIDAHKTMNKIQGHMKQIPQHMETIAKIVSSKTSTEFIHQNVSRSIKNIERITNTCIALARGVENSFISVTKVPIESKHNLLQRKISGRVGVGSPSIDLDHERTNEIELNITRKEEEERQQRYEEIRQTIVKVREEYFRALKDIPSGHKAFAIDFLIGLGRAAYNGLKEYYRPSKTEGSVTLKRQVVSKDKDQSFATDQIINFASGFGESLNSLIETLSKYENQMRNDDKELQAYKVIFKSFINIVNIFPSNNLSIQIVNIIKRTITLIDLAIKDQNTTIIGELKTLANDIKPFMVAEQLSNNNNAPISVSSKNDSSSNELLKARLAKARLSKIESRFNKYDKNHATTMEEMRSLTSQLGSLNLTVITFKNIRLMIERSNALFHKLRKIWNNLIVFFTNFSARFITGLNINLKPFINAENSTFDAEETEINRKLIWKFIQGDSDNLYHESYVIFVLSRTYYDISSKYLMPSVTDLSHILTNSNNNERRKLLVKLKRGIKNVQKKVKQLINERGNIFEKAVSKKRAEINEIIDDQGEDGDEEDIIEKGEKLLQYE